MTDELDLTALAWHDPERYVRYLAEQQRHTPVSTRLAEAAARASAAKHRPGMSTRAIAPIVGTSQMQVVRDIQRGAPETNVSPAPETDPEPVADPVTGGVANETPAPEPVADPVTGSAAGAGSGEKFCSPDRQVRYDVGNTSHLPADPEPEPSADPVTGEIVEDVRAVLGDDRSAGDNPSPLLVVGHAAGGDRTEVRYRNPRTISRAKPGSGTVPHFADLTTGRPGWPGSPARADLRRIAEMQSQLRRDWEHRQGWRPADKPDRKEHR